jgi:hypothetical protein
MVDIRQCPIYVPKLVGYFVQSYRLKGTLPEDAKRALQVCSGLIQKSFAFLACEVAAEGGHLP